MAVTAFGEPLRLIDYPDEAVPEGHALLRVLTCGVCHTDVKIARGRMPFSPRQRLPHVLGHEVLGEVLETNPPGLLGAGTRVVVYQYWGCGLCGPCRRGTEQLCTDLAGWVGFVDPGGYRERMSTPVERLLPVPDGVDPVHGAPMTCAIGTSVRAVTTRGAVRDGTRVVVIGLGGVGMHTAQVAMAVGGRTIGLDVHEPTVEAARALGVDARPADEIPNLRSELHGAGVDVVIDTVGTAESHAVANDLVRIGGRIVAVGYASGTTLGLDVRRLVLEEIEVVGSRYASREEMARGIQLVAEGLVRPVVGMVRRLEDANEVLEALEQGDLVGRGVLEIS